MVSNIIDDDIIVHKTDFLDSIEPLQLVEIDDSDGLLYIMDGYDDDDDDDDDDYDDDDDCCNLLILFSYYFHHHHSLSCFSCLYTQIRREI